MKKSLKQRFADEITALEKAPTFPVDLREMRERHARMGRLLQECALEFFIRKREAEAATHNPTKGNGGEQA